MIGESGKKRAVCSTEKRGGRTKEESHLPEIIYPNRRYWEKRLAWPDFQHKNSAIPSTLIVGLSGPRSRGPTIKEI